MPDRATQLAQSLQDAEQAVRDLSEKVNVNEATIRRAKFAATAALWGIGFHLLLVVLIGWGLHEVDANQHRIEDLQQTQQAQTERNRTAQCAVNALLLQFEPRTLSNPSYTEEQRREQIRVYETLRSINRDLGCDIQ